MSSATEDDDRTLVDLCHELLETWNAPTERYVFQDRSVRRVFGRTEARFLEVFGLAAHVHCVADAALRLLETGVVLEATPLVRLAFEGAITAQWLAQTPDGTAAFLNEAERSRRSAARHLATTNHPILSRGGADMVAAERATHATSSTEQAKNFKQRCLDLRPDGATLYAYYKVLCVNSHATPHAVERFVRSNDEWNAVRSLQTTPKAEPGEADLLVYFLLCSLVWAGRAVDYQDATKRRRTQLRDVARAIGITSELHPTPEAQLRIESPQTASA